MTGTAPSFARLYAVRLLTPSRFPSSATDRNGRVTVALICAVIHRCATVISSQPQVATSLGGDLIDEQNTRVDVNSKRWPAVEVTIPDSSNRFALVIFFAHLGEDAAFLGFEVTCEDDEGLDPRSFARLARNLPMYVDYARAMSVWKQGKHEDRIRALEALRREAGKSRRGLPDTFYREIAAEYEALVEADDPHPIKTIAEARPVDKSRASRWVTEARDRGYIKPTKKVRTR
jgi:hypothetical protein